MKTSPYKFFTKLLFIESPDRRLDHIFETIDRCCSNGDFEMVDNILCVVRDYAPVFSSTDLVGFLAISGAAHRHGEINNYREMYEAIECHFNSKFNKKKVIGLLGGFRNWAECC